MVPECVIWLNDKEITRIHSTEQMEEFFNGVMEGFNPKNPLFIIKHENGNILYLGISNRGCTASWEDKLHKEPYYASLGTIKPENEGEIITFFMSETNHATEVPKKHTVGFEDILRVAKVFLETGAHPAKEINWTTDF